MNITLKDIWGGLGGTTETPPSYKTKIKDVVIDSRKATSGSLFVALKGENTDGHNFIANAIENGAVAVLCREGWKADLQYPTVDAVPGKEPPELNGVICFRVKDTLFSLQEIAAHWRSKFDVTVVGVTGSVGKSSTKELAASVASQRFGTLKSEGNYNNEIGLPLTLLRLQPEHEVAVLEMGMYAIGEIKRLAEIARPTIGVVTNVGPVHLERLKTIERIAQAKSELVEALPEDGVAILNADDPLTREMAQKTKARVFFYGLTPSSDLWADGIESLGIEGTRFWLHYGDEKLHVHIPLLGRHSVHTALRAASVGLALGLDWEEIIRGLQDQRARLRLLAVPGINGSTILDDTYNSSPDSALAALNLLAELDGRKIAVLGDMLELGSYEETGHRLVGRRAAEVTDHLITVGPRASMIGEEARSQGMPAENIHIVSTNREAVDILKEILTEGDNVLVKGSRGMRMEEIVSQIALEEGDATWPIH
jgi:UDP-N-acetylmuramoyl-tripeptide--D-alanyl-D-alanine ligase